MRLSRVAASCLLLFFMARGAAAGFPIFAQNWQDYSPSERYEALRNYRRHQKLPREEQQEVERRYERWRQMEPDERAKIQRNYEKYRSLSPSEQDQFERKYRNWRREQPAR